MARRYRFPLATLLRLREQAEEARKKEFAAATRAVREEQERREGLEKERAAMQEDIVRLYAEKVHFSRITATYRDIGMLGGEIFRSGLRQQQLEKLVEETRQRLIEAQRQRRAMEILRDTRKEEFEREAERKEQANLDEMAIRARARFLAEEAARAEEGLEDAPEVPPEVPPEDVPEDVPAP